MGLANKYRIDLKKRRSTEDTVKEYINIIEEFNLHLGYELTESNIKKLEVDNFQNYIDYLVDVEQYSKSTIEKRKTIVYSFYKWAMVKFNRKENMIPKDQIRIPKSELNFEKKKMKVSEAIYIVDTQKDLRKKLILALQLYSGLRFDEVLNLSMDDVNFDNNTIYIKPDTSKGRKERTTILTPNVKEMLEEYKDHKKFNHHRNKKNLLYFSCGTKGATYKKLDKSTVNAWCRKHYKSLGLTDTTIYRNHNLRHCFGQMLLDKGVEVTKISKLMGHANVNVTMNTYLVQNSEDVALSIGADIFNA